MSMYLARVEIDGLTRESYREVCLRWVHEVLPARSPEAWARILAGESATFGGTGDIGVEWPPWGEPGGLFGDWVIVRHRDARDVDFNDEGSPGHFVQSRKRVSRRAFERDLPLQLADPAPSPHRAGGAR